jgi:type IV secretory pathway VirB10-like protein
MPDPTLNPSNQNPGDPGAGAPQVSWKTPRLPGVLPQSLKTWVALGVASLMAITMFCSSGTPKEKSDQHSVVQSRFATTGREIDQYKALLKAETDTMEANNKRLTQAKRDAEAAERAALSSQATSATQAGSYSHGGGASAPPLERSPIETERQLAEVQRTRRAEQSLFASNVALSYRKEGAPAPASESAKTAATPVTAVVESASSPRETAATKEAPTSDNRDRRRSKSDDPALQESTGKLFRLFEGTILETVLTNRLDGSFAGPVNVMVTSNVYSHERQQLLIPQGTRILGEVEKVSGVSQQRLAVFFHRLIMPDGYAHSLDKFQALSETGETGLRDQVNHHYAQVFGASLAIGAIAGIEQAGANYGASTTGIDAYQRGASQSLSQSALHILDRFLNSLPTFTVREGHRIKIILTNDLELPAYGSHTLPTNL